MAFLQNLLPTLTEHLLQYNTLLSIQADSLLCPDWLSKPVPRILDNVGNPETPITRSLLASLINKTNKKTKVVYKLKNKQQQQQQNQAQAEYDL